MASNVARVLDEKLANAECQDPKGMYFDGSSWVKGEAPGTVPKTKAIFHGQMNGKFACGVDLAKFQKEKAEEEAKAEKTHASATEKVFRSQYAQMDWREKWEPELKAEKAKKAKFPSTKLQFYDQTNPYGEEDPLDTLENWHKEFNETMTEVEVDGKPYYEYGADKGGRKLKGGPMKGQVVSQIDIPPLFRIPKAPDKMTIYDHEGNLKKEGDGPLGIAYDAEGIPVPDWEIVDTSKTAGGVDVLDEQGRRKGGLQVRGVVKMKDYANATKRCYPQWGKRFGLVTKPRVGRFGSYTCDEAKLCLTTEDFGFKLGEDAARDAAADPPAVRRGREGDPLGGPRPGSASRAKKLEQDQADLNEERLAALKARCKEQATMPWYRDYFPNGEYDYETGKMINTPGTLPGETPPLQTIEGQIDDDKE
ncbi:hypothetical protein JL720_11200 [Aureococcus anophagefferens]|nr:hypothetical protein JL720_11200 [Aureococcus anophagefferens]